MFKFFDRLSPPCVVGSHTVESSIEKEKGLFTSLVNGGSHLDACVAV